MSARPVELNPDGVSVRGCDYIYAPGGEAGEYARLAANPYRGCGHGCVYCYVPQTIWMSRAKFNEGAVPRTDFMKHLLREASKYRDAGVTEQVMLSFTTDPYHPGDTSLTRQTIEALREHGLGFCTLTKGGSLALRDLDLFRRDRDAFASTLTTLDEEVSLRWEPKAALPGDRIETLERFHAAGVFVWVSLEPVYDTEATLAVIERTHEIVDFYKVGHINYSKLTKRIDWKSFTREVTALLNRCGSAHYVKEDLQSYLPAGYPNVRHRPQYFANPGAL